MSWLYPFFTRRAPQSRRCSQRATTAPAAGPGHGGPDEPADAELRPAPQAPAAATGTLDRKAWRPPLCGLVLSRSNQSAESGREPAAQDVPDHMGVCWDAVIFELPGLQRRTAM